MSNPHDSHQDPHLRASDADRDQVAEALRDHHTEGRLDTDELQQRIDACYQAKTIADLDTLLHDLPRKQPQQHHSDRFPHPRGFLRRRMLRLSPILIALIALSIVTGHHFFWLAIPLFFLTTRLLAPRCARRRTRTNKQWA
jgi:hypothetical protein